MNPNNINFGRLGNTGKERMKMSSFFANASYSYEDRYILTGAIRYDGSDIIGNRNQFTPLWNVASRWICSGRIYGVFTLGEISCHYVVVLVTPEV